MSPVDICHSRSIAFFAAAGFALSAFFFEVLPSFNWLVSGWLNGRRAANSWLSVLLVLRGEPILSTSVCSFVCLQYKYLRFLRY